MWFYKSKNVGMLLKQEECGCVLGKWNFWKHGSKRYNIFRVVLGACGPSSLSCFDSKDIVNRTILIGTRTTLINCHWGNGLPLNGLHWSPCQSLNQISISCSCIISILFNFNFYLTEIAFIGLHFFLLNGTDLTHESVLCLYKIALILYSVIFWWPLFLQSSFFCLLLKV